MTTQKQKKPATGTAEREEVAPQGGEGNTSAADEERRRVADEIAARLRRRGIWLSSHESSLELANLLEAVERFELVVERNGGDLMMDEPVAGASEPVAPDDAAFVLPARKKDEGVASFIDRIVDASILAGKPRGRG